MTLRTQIVFVVALVIVVGAIVGISTYLVMDAHKREAVAQAKVDAAQQVIVAKQQVIDASDKSIAKRDQEFAAWKEQHDAEVKQVTNAAQAAVELNKKGLGLKTVAAPTPQNPNAVAYELPPEKLIPLYQAAAACDERDRELDSCKADLVDTNTKAGALETQRDEAVEQRDAWQVSAKGGSKTARFFGGLKKVGIGALIALGVTCASGHCK